MTKHTRSLQDRWKDKEEQYQMKDKLELQKQYIEVKKKYDELSEKYWSLDFEVGTKSDIRVAMHNLSIKTKLEKELREQFILLKSINKQLYYGESIR